MKLATKKIFHNVLALAVSVCMVCTMTPALAWGAPAVSGETVMGAKGDSTTASGETTVKGRVYNSDFAFSAMSPDANYDNKDKFLEALAHDPLTATMPEKGIPDNYTVAWYMQKVVPNPDFDSDKPESSDNPKYLRQGDAQQIAQGEYTKANTPIAKDEDGNDVPTFVYPAGGAEPSGLDMKEGESYEFSIVMVDTATDDQAHAETIISLFSDYPHQIIVAEDKAPISVNGDIYQKFDPFNPGVSVLEATDVDDTDDSYNKLKEAAANNKDGAQDIVEATQLKLINNAKPDDADPYMNELEVRLPVPCAITDPQFGDEVNVYVLDDEGNVKIIKGTIGHEIDKEGGTVADDDGNPIPVVVVPISGTGVNLGTFAIGTPSTGTYTVIATATEGGEISPAGTTKQPLGSATTFATYALVPHYNFTGFALTVDGATKTIRAEDLGYNNVTINPSVYGITENSEVTLTANYSLATPGFSTQKTRIHAELKNEDGAGGSFKVSTLLVKGMKNSAGKDITLASGTVKVDQDVTAAKALPWTYVDSNSGLFFEFFPEEGSYVKSVTFRAGSGAEKSASFAGNSLMLGTVGNAGANVEIKVTYAKGGEVDTSQNKVAVSVQQRNGYYPANITSSDGSVVFKTDYTVVNGGQLTIKAQPYKDIYQLDGVYVLTPADSDQLKEFLDQPEGSQLANLQNAGAMNLVKRVYVSPNNSVSNYPQDEIQLYNISSNACVQLVYKILSANISGEQTEGGIWGWLPGGGDTEIEGNALNTPTVIPMRAKARAAAAPTAAAQADDPDYSFFDGVQIQTGKLQLKQEGDWARLVVRPQDGYELGDVTINGVRVNNMLTEREDPAGRAYTLAVYLGPAGSAGDQVGTFEGSSTRIRDKIFYISANEAVVKITFNSSTIKMPTFNLITTGVTEFGGGTITPTRNVENGGSATINFFPDKGYRIDKMWLDGEEVVDGDNGGRCEIHIDAMYMILDNVTTDHDVLVSFTPLKPGEDENYKTRYTINATAGAGGSITPYGNFLVYEGDNQDFVLVPHTGFAISTVTVDGVEKTEKDGIFTSRNTLRLQDIRKDTNVAVTFKPLASSNAATYTVTASKEGNGTIQPASAVTVAAGGNIAYSVIPDNGWYVQDVRTTYTTGTLTTEASLFSLFDSNTFVFQLSDVREDMHIKAVFARLDGAGNIPGTDTKPPEPPKDKISLGTDLNPSGVDYGTPTPGAVLTPSPSELDVIEEIGPDGNKTGHGNTDLMFTVTVADGYELNEPIAGNDGNSGIVIKAGDDTIIGAVMKGDQGDDGHTPVIEQTADGVYTITVPKEKVVPGLNFQLNTHPKTASTEAVNLKDVSIEVVGEGYVSPGMAKVGDTPKTIKVEKGKNQTFSFFAASKWKLHTVYLNDVPTSVTGNVLTIPNIQEDTTLKVVFSALAEGEEAPATPKSYTVDIQPGNGVGVSPFGKVSVIEGAGLTISADPGAGYRIKATDNGVAVPVNGNSVELSNVRANHTVIVDREQIIGTEYQELTVTSKGPGVTSPTGTLLVVKGQSQTITLIPEAGKKVKSVRYSNGDDLISSVNPVTMSFTVGPINESTGIFVEFCEADQLVEGDRDLPPNDGTGPDNYYTVSTSEPNGGGILLPAEAQVAAGGNVNLTVFPYNGYELETIMVGSTNRTSDVKDGTLAITNVTGDVSVRAYFKKINALQLDDYYTLFINAEGDADGGGTVSPSGAITVAGGGTQVITMLPDPGYKVAYIEASHNGTVISRVDNFTGSSYSFFNVSQDMNIRVKFVKGSGGANVLTHDITATSTVSGRISPEGTVKVADGANASFTFIPNPGCKLSYVTIDGNQIPAESIGNNQYIFMNVFEDHRLHAVFVKEAFNPDDYVTVSIGKATGGTVNPSDSVLVKKGEDQTLTLTPFYGYRLSGLSVTMGYDGTGNQEVINISPIIGSIDGLLHTENGVDSRWEYHNSQLTLKKVDSNMRVTARFERQVELGSPNDTPTYIPVTASTSGKDGADGTTIIGSGGYVISPDFTNSLNDLSPYEISPQITITPGPGYTVDTVTLTYGDNSRYVVDDKGAWEYDKDGWLLGKFGDELKPMDADGNEAIIGADGVPTNGVKYPAKGTKPTYDKPDARQIYEQGYITMDGKKAVETNGIDCNAVFRPLTDAEKAEINDPDNQTLVPAEYVEFNATYRGGGRIFPEGRFKAAVGQGVVMQFMPSPGYEVASVIVDGVDKTAEVMNHSTRAYIFTPEDLLGADGNPTNHTVDVTFGFIGDAVNRYYTVTSTATKIDQNADGSTSISRYDEGVSPNSISAPEGSDPTVYFFPPDGYKVSNLKVTKGGEVIANVDNYERYLYTVSRIDGSVNIEVTYAPAGADDIVWQITPVRISATCPDGHGKVSPSDEVLVPAGSPQTFFFEPDDGYLVDYVLFNNVATTLKNNPSSFTVTPSAGAENVLQVFFREATVKDKQYFDLVPVLTEGSHATISPSSMNVEAGSTVSFYISPDEHYTMDSVTIDGWPVSVRPALPEGQQPVPGSEYTMYIATIENVQPGSVVEVTTKPTSKRPIEVKSHSMIIRGQNVIYSPMGTIQVPEGGYQDITVSPLKGYYLDSILVAEYDDAGNRVGDEIDMTDDLSANVIRMPMGAYTKVVAIKYLPVGGSEKPTPAYITLGNTKTDDGRDVNATIAMRMNSDGSLVPLRIDPETRKFMEARRDEGGNLLRDENGDIIYVPMEFVRGGSYTFYAVADPIDGKELILSGATFNGNEQIVPNLTGMIAGMRLTSSGVLDLTFRELKDGETPIVTRTFNVEFKVLGEKGGTINPSTAMEGLTIPIGSTTGPISMVPESDNWMIESVILMPYTVTVDAEGKSKREYVYRSLDDAPQVDPSEYRDETYNCRPLQDLEVWVSFTPCTIVDVQWDSELGFVAPNPYGNYLKLPVENEDEDQPYEFIVAPYESCYVRSMTAEQSDGDVLDYTHELTQSESVAAYLSEAGFNIKDFTPGAGIVSPDDDGTGSNVGGDSSSSSSESGAGTFAVMALTTRDDGYGAINDNGIVPARGTTMQNAYGVTTALDPVKTTVNVDLYTTKEPDTVYHKYTITPRVNGTGGRIEPSSAQTVEGGGSQTFNFIADSGYSLKRVLVDGSPISGGQLGTNGTSYTFLNVDRNHTIEAEFGAITSDESSRLLRVASQLAQTGDLTGPAVGALLIVAALGLALTAISYIRRQQRRRRRRAEAMRQQA